MNPQSGPDSPPVAGSVFAYLRGGGVAVLLDTSGPGLPSILYWGADLGTLTDEQAAALVAVTVPAVAHAGLDNPERSAVVAERFRGQAAPLGISGRRPDGSGWSVRLLRDLPRSVATLEHVVRAREGDPAIDEAHKPRSWDRLHSTASDRDAGLEASVDFAIDASGILTLQASVTNTADTPFQLDSLALSLPVPERAAKILSLSGRWGSERIADQLPVTFGTWLRDTTEGRSGHDFPIALIVSSKDCDWRSGEAWAVSLCWSGNHRHLVERRPDGSTWISASELLLPGELDLGPGETYKAPAILAGWSNRGFDGISARFHSHLRSRPTHPRSPRPLTFNSWEAMYFAVSEERLIALARSAAAVGVERFVVDDGWFHSRTSERRGLGDWWIDTGRLPDGLHRVAGTVGELGMQLGLWVEPEMISPDSDLARAHPEWMLGVSGRLPPEGRHQQVLDLSRPQVYAYLLDRLDALLSEYPISYLKWDHNRPLTDAADAYGRPAAHRQTLALYALIAALKDGHPGLEIESCASGGGRVDLGMLRLCDRVWASDSIDPVDRQEIQRWTSLVIPPEMIGSHVGAPRAHVSGRHTDLSFRAATALFAHAGIEWDVSALGDDDLDYLRRWAALYKARRGLIHSGTVVRLEHSDASVIAHGVVAKDGSEGLYCLAQLEASRASLPSPLRLDGLDPGRVYRIAVDDIFAKPVTVARTAPPWWPGPVELTGRGASLVGLTVPILTPGQAVVIHAVGQQPAV